MNIDFETIEDELETDIPDAYKDFIAMYEEAGGNDGLLGDLILDDTQSLIESNERTAEVSLAGLDVWPAEYVVFADDGCGNFYAFDSTTEAAQVLFYNHESDELVVEAESLLAFGEQLVSDKNYDLINSHDREPKVISSGYKQRKQKAEQQARIIKPLSKREFVENWQTDWAIFAPELIAEISRGLDERQLTISLNKKFGGKPVWWVGVVDEIDLGEYKSVSIEMPTCAHVPNWDSYHWATVSPDLRTEEEPWHEDRDPGHQILTSISAWKSIKPGDTISFQMMIAPGHGDSIACIDIKRYGNRPPYICIQNCGGHVTSVN